MKKPFVFHKRSFLSGHSPKTGIDWFGVTIAYTHGWDRHLSIGHWAGWRVNVGKICPTHHGIRFKLHRRKHGYYTYGFAVYEPLFKNPLPLA